MVIKSKIPTISLSGVSCHCICNWNNKSKEDKYHEPEYKYLM